MYNGLVRYDTDLNIAPDLAESWEFSKDATSAVFTLRKGIKFHDGTDCDAVAVKYNFDRVMDKNFKSFRLGYYETLSNIIALDKTHVKFEFSRPSGGFLEALMLRGAFGISSPAAIEKYGKKYGWNVKATGPYMMKEHRAGSYLLLEPFKDYWDESRPPLFNEVKILRMPNATTRDLAIRNGEIHLNTAQEPATAAIVAKDPKVEILNAPAVRNVWYNLAPHHEKFADIRVRQAILYYGLDRQEIVDAVFGGMAKPQVSWVPIGSPYYTPYPEYLKYDPEKAKALLKEAGVADLTFDLTFSTRYAVAQDMATVMKTQYQKIGVTMNLNVVDFAAFIRGINHPSGMAFEASMNVAAAKVDPGEIRPYVTDTKKNWNRYLNPEIDKLFLDLDATADPAERKQLYAKLFKIHADQAMWGAVTSFPVMKAIRKEVQNYRDPANMFTKLDGVWLKQKA